MDVIIFFVKLITLNIWGGQVYEPLIEFIKEQGKNVDIFCFQEVINGIKGEKTEVISNAPNAIVDIYSQIQAVLSKFQGYFAPAQKEAGNAIFIRKNIQVAKEDNFFVYRFRDSYKDGKTETTGRNLQYIQFKVEGEQFTIANLHGLWAPGGKGDTPERIEQFKKVKEFLDDCEGGKILCGDFNLWLKTKSMAILEKEMKNLVKDYGFTSTRSSFYDKDDLFADYIMVSKDINVLDFKVLQDEVSDHLPLFLEFN